MAKRPSIKTPGQKIHETPNWGIFSGQLKRPRGRPGKIEPLFSYVAEKIPFSALGAVRKLFRDQGVNPNGVYIAHDSMGYPRYIGRGNTFQRLAERKRAQRLELKYFSIFIIKEKIHEREIETILIRAAGPLLDFNERKVRTDTQAGDIRDFEPGTAFVERRDRKARRGTRATSSTE